MARRQAVQRLVRERGEEVEVAQEGQRQRARREAEAAAAAAQRVEDGGEAGEEEEGGGEEVSCGGHFHGGWLAGCSASELTGDQLCACAASLL